MPRGGKRAGAGRRKNTTDDGAVGKGFATRVLSRIKELNLKSINSAEDYALDILKRQSLAGEDSFFRYMVDRQFGKPVQATIQRDTRESIPELDFGNLTMPADSKPGKAGKPN